MRKKVLSLVVVLAMVLGLTACGGASVTPDYANAESFEAALNNGENLEGKVVTFEVENLEPQSAMGYDIWAGEHLNFVSNSNPNVKAGDTVTVKVKKVESMLGSWFITYDKVK